MSQAVCLEVCSNCGMKDEAVVPALQRLQKRYGEAVKVEVAGCLFSCNFPAVFVAGQQILVRGGDTARLEALVATAVAANATRTAPGGAPPS